MKERKGLGINGWLMLLVVIALFLGGGWLIWEATGNGQASTFWTGIVLVVVGGVLASGFVINQPNIAKVVTFFGRYLGTVRRNGLTWTVPLTNREQVSLRIQNFDSEILKVNDANGNPVEVAAVIVWRVVDTAQAVFDVEDYQDFVRIQTETAVRHMASEYPYDAYEEGQHSLRGNADEVTTSLHQELQTQLTLPAWRCYAPSCADSPTPPRSPPTCSAASRPRRWWPPATHRRRRGGDGRPRAGDAQRRSTSSSSTRSGRRPWSPISWWSSAASTMPSRCSTPAPSTSRKDGGRAQELPAPGGPGLHAALEKWAADELRSVNAQIEFLLTRAVRESGRERKKHAAEEEPMTHDHDVVVRNDPDNHRYVLEFDGEPPASRSITRVVVGTTSSTPRSTLVMGVRVLARCWSRVHSTTFGPMGRPSSPSAPSSPPGSHVTRITRT